MQTNSELQGLGLLLCGKNGCQRTVAIGIAIGCFVLLFYAVTVAKLGPGVLDGPL